MNKLLLGGAAAAAFLAIAPATAQPAPPAATQVQTQVHRMPMRVQTRDQVVSHVRDMFAKLDTNRDGFVTKAEADAGRQALKGGIREKFARRLANRGDRAPDRGAMFDRLDTNRDGAISRQEFMAAQSQRRERRVIVMREGGAAGAPGATREFRMHRMGGMSALRGRMFEMADANRDGRVSIQEATDAALRHFDTADVNRDGRITPEERMQRRQRMKAQRQQPA